MLLGSILGIVAASILICCGPTTASADGGRCKTLAAFILYLIAAFAELASALLNLSAYLQVLGIWSALGSFWAPVVIPPLVIGTVTGILQIVGAVTAWKATKSIDASKASVATGTPVASGATATV